MDFVVYYSIAYYIIGVVVSINTLGRKYGHPPDFEDVLLSMLVGWIIWPLLALSWVITKLMGWRMQ